MHRFLLFLMATLSLGFPATLRADLDQDALVVEGLNRALEANPDDASARVKRGLYHLWRTFDYEKALADFNVVLEQDPENVEAHIGRADVYTGWDARYYNPKSAEADARAALALAPQSSEVYRLLGDLPGHPGMGETQDALTHYRRAVELDPDNLLAQIGLAYTYAKKDTPFHDEQKAMWHAAKAMELAPQESLALEAMGDLLTSDETTRRDGIRLLNRAVRTNPRSLSAYLARGYAYLLWSMEEEWGALLQALEEQQLTLLDSIRGDDEAFARAVEKLGDKSYYARALRDFESAEALCPHSDDVLTAQAYALQNFPGQERRALDFYTRAVELNAFDANSRVERADFLINNPHLMIQPEDVAGREGDLDGALLGGMIATRFPEVSRVLERDLGRALEISPEAEAYFLRGSLRGSALQDYRGAVSDLTEAIRLEPLEAQYYEARASVHEAFGHDEKADEDRELASDLQDLD